MSSYDSLGSRLSELTSQLNQYDAEFDQVVDDIVEADLDALDTLDSSATIECVSVLFSTGEFRHATTFRFEENKDLQSRLASMKSGTLAEVLKKPRIVPQVPHAWWYSRHFCFIPTSSQNSYDSVSHCICVHCVVTQCYLL